MGHQGRENWDSGRAGEHVKGKGNSTGRDWRRDCIKQLTVLAGLGRKPGKKTAFILLLAILQVRFSWLTKKAALKQQD